MTLKSPFSVRIQKHGKALGDAMNEIRSWLDSHKIQPTDFRFKHSVTGAAAFEIKFNREEEACLFERAFTRPPSEPSRRE
ncbi:MAG: hypothetical protein WB611_05655 [Stellaceae bacterium]